jgi:hypothetical protein
MLRSKPTRVELKADKDDIDEFARERERRHRQRQSSNMADEDINSNNGPQLAVPLPFSATMKPTAQERIGYRPAK